MLSPLPKSNTFPNMLLRGESVGASITRKIYGRPCGEIPAAGMGRDCIYLPGKNFKASLKLMARTLPD